MYYLLKSKDFISGEIPSTNMIACAKSLGLLGAYMANKGTFNGKEMISKETWDKLH
jgi:hypothetical protein